MVDSVMLQCYIEKEDDQYVATVHELNVSSYGDTVDEAIERVGQALGLYLETLAEDGELESVLRSRDVLRDPHPVAQVDRPGLLGTLLRMRLPSPV